MCNVQNVGEHMYTCRARGMRLDASLQLYSPHPPVQTHSGVDHFFRGADLGPQPSNKASDKAT